MGCTAADACNFNPNANVNDGSCYFIGDPCDDGQANTINDTYNANCACEGIIGVEESEVIQLSLYPNPASDVLTLTSNIAGWGKMQIVDLTGRVVFQNNQLFSANQEVNIAELPHGMYSLAVTFDQKQAVITFIKL